MQKERIMKIKNILSHQMNNHKIAITYQNRNITYKELHNNAVKNADILSRKTSNRNIGIFINNSIEYAIAYFTIAYMDKVIIPIEDHAKKDSVRSILKYCEISLVLTNTGNDPKLFEMLADYPYRVDIYNVETGQTFVVNPECAYIEVGGEDETDVAIMLHTSGTTSNPKRVMLTNRNLLANIESNVASLDLREDDRCLIILPMFFGYCNTSQFLSHLYVGASLVIYDSSFYPRKFLELIDREKCTNTTCVPSMLFMVINTCRRETYDLSSLRYLCFGGGSMPIDKLEKILCFFDKTGVIQTYGQTEASPRVTCLLPEDAKRKIGSVGKPIPGVTVKIDDKQLRELPPGETGEILVKGDNVMKGYYKQPEITAKTIENGWLHTGDLGRFDEEGYLYIAGRLNNVIISGGLNIYPEEIEEVLLGHDKVKEALVTAEPHPILSEVPIARVILKEGAKADGRELIEYCLKRLPGNKVPGRIVFCEEFEKTYTGKIKRKGRKN